MANIITRRLSSARLMPQAELPAVAPPWPRQAGKATLALEAASSQAPN